MVRRIEQFPDRDEARFTRGHARADSDPLRVERGITEIERDVFRVRVSTGDRDPLSGSPKQLERIVRGGIREARRVRSELQAKVIVGLRGAPSMTVGELLDEWLAGCAKRLGKPGRAGLEPSTYNNYELQVRTLKATRLASVRLEHLTTRQPIEETYEALEDVLGPARRVQVHKALRFQVHKALRSAFNHAMGEGWMSMNPAALVRTRPPEPKTRRATPTSEQVGQAYAIARRFDPDLDVFLATAALTGLRRQAAHLMHKVPNRGESQLTGLRHGNCSAGNLASVHVKTAVVGGQAIGLGSPAPGSFALGTRSCRFPDDSHLMR
jgi:hypothetical protein